MINVTLKGGAVKEFEPGVSPADVAKSIGMGLYKSACAARVDGEAVDLRTPLEKDCELEILTFDSPEGKHAFWHTGAHIMAQAIQHLFPDAQFGIGPALDDGWYYDIGGTEPFTPDQFEAIEELGRTYEINEGDGAFYGPKLDFHLVDAIGRTWQCGTIQLDMQMPERFELEYTGADGQKHRPVMIHRVVFGSIERFIGILIEHFAGAFPVWLAPVQAKVIPISEAHHAYAKQVEQELRDAGLRVEGDYRAEKMGYKIREAQLEKIPYMLVVGAQEMENGTVSVRARKEEKGGTKTVEEFKAQVLAEVASRER